jgi:hypothetical protein
VARSFDATTGTYGDAAPKASPRNLAPERKSEDRSDDDGESEDDDED